MGSLRRLAAALAAWCVFCGAVAASGLVGQARIDGASAQVVEAADGVRFELTLSQPVPWRVFTLDDPRRLVLDFRTAVFDGSFPEAGGIAGIRTGSLFDGWSRLVADLEAPLAVAEASLDTSRPDGRARLKLRLARVTPKDFAERSGAPADAMRLLDPSVPAPPPVTKGRIRVMLDPGHGGIDPGAEVGGLREADLMLGFARELREALLKDGAFDVAMTRDDDVFVPLETRLTIARASGADLFLSLHADALPEGAGQASGATVYTLSAEASDAASQRLAERHDRADLMAGLDLSGQSDEIALVLMEIARRETAPRSGRLAEAIVEGLETTAGNVNRNPLRSAAFSVLKSPDIPSVLIELGFLSSARDRARLADPEWRRMAVSGIVAAIHGWHSAEQRLGDGGG